ALQKSPVALRGLGQPSGVLVEHCPLEALFDDVVDRQQPLGRTQVPVGGAVQAQFLQHGRATGQYIREDLRRAVTAGQSNGLGQQLSSVPRVQQRPVGPALGAQGESQCCRVLGVSGLSDQFFGLRQVPSRIRRQAIEQLSGPKAEGFRRCVQRDSCLRRKIPARRLIIPFTHVT
ncbi:MAG: hypothetical protein QG608_577, partial [Actinomycetota bacterium]|nr:hypothetical protein [Actinomycetota bacterium]